MGFNMINKNNVLRVLDTVVHPETGAGLAAGGFVADVSISAGENGGEDVSVALKFRRTREPFAASLLRGAEAALSKEFPSAAISVSVFDSSPSVTTPVPSRRLPGVSHIVAVASGKGGVGKSTVAANLAIALAAEGFRVGVLDADIYGPSQPTLFGIEGYVPPVVPAGRTAADRSASGSAQGKKGRSEEKTGDVAVEAIVPAESMGVKVMSIGFFIDPADALVWRGPMANSALKQLIHQTAWGDLDWLLIDLPPGTGDVHLTIVHELALDGAVIVSTPGRLAIDDVRRGVGMFRSEGVDVPVLGIVENMSWFSPAELPQNRYYVFGKDGTKLFAEQESVDFLGEIPLVLPADEGVGQGFSTLSHNALSDVKARYGTIAGRIVDKLGGRC